MVTFNGSSNVAIQGSSTSTFANLVINTSTNSVTVTNSTKAFAVSSNLTVTKGNLTLTATDADYVVSGNLTVASNGTLTHNVDWDTYGKLINVGGNLSVDGIYTKGSAGRAHVTMTGSTKTVHSGTSAFDILTFSTNGTITADGALTVNNNFWAPFNTSGTFTTAGNTITVNGGMIVGGGTLNVNGGTVNVSGGFYVGYDANGGNKATVNLSGGTLTTDGLILGGSTNAVTTAASTINQTGGTLVVNGDVTINQPTANNITTAWNINASTATVSGLITFAGSNTTTSRVAKIVTTTGTLNANGGITFTASAAATKVIDMSGGAGNLNLKGALTVPAASSTLTPGTTSTFSYADAGDQTVNVFSTGNYSNLTFSGGATKTLSTALTISNKLTVAAGVTADLGTFRSTAATLTLGATAQATGTSYGGTGSPAANINPTYFVANTGYLNVGTCSNYSLTSVTTVTGAVCSGSSATINLNSTSAILPNGTYTVSYTLGSPNGGTGTATMIVSGNTGKGSFTTSALANVGSTSITINTIAGGCVSVISTNNTATITMLVGGNWTGVTSSDWNTASNWCGGVPTATTDVVIPSGTPNLPIIAAGTTALCNNLTVNTSATLSMAASATSLLNINGNFTNSGTFTAGAGSTVNYVGGNQSVAGVTYSNLTTSGSGDKTLSAAVTVSRNLFVGTGTRLVDNEKQITGNATGTLTVEGNATLFIGMTSAGTAPTQFPTNFTKANIDLQTNSTVYFNGQQAQTISYIPDYYNIICQYPGTKSTSGTGTLTILGNFETASPVSFASATAVNITGDLNLLAVPAAITLPNGTLSIQGDFNNNLSAGGSITVGTGTVAFNGTGAQSITGGTAVTTRFNNLTVNKASGTVTVANSSPTVASNLNVTSGTLDVATYTVNRLTTGGTLSVSNGATLRIGGTANYPANYSTNTFGATSTVEYYMTGAQTVSTRTYGNLLLSGSGAKSIANGTSVAAGNLSITGTAVANVAAGANIPAGSLTLGIYKKINGTWGSTSSAATYKDNTYFSATTGIVTVTNDTRPTAVLSGLTASPSICFGTATTTLSGTVNDGGTVLLQAGETIGVTINGVTQNTTISGSLGAFSINFNTSTIPASGTPYTITYSYTSTTNTSFKAATANTSTSLTVKALPTLTGASQSATVCAGSAATINLTGLLASSTSTVSYTINGVAQTAATGVVANASGAASFSTPVLTGTNNGQTLQITGVTITSAGAPNCGQSFTQNVTLAVNPTPTLTSATRTPVCDGSSSTINLAGLLANSTSTIDYTIGGIAQTAVTGVVANASGAASFTTPALTASNNGQTLQITGVTVTSATPNCSQSFTRNLTLIVYPVPTLSGASQAASVCAGSAATINLTGLLANTTFSVYYSINGVARTPITGVVSDASGAASFTSAALTAANNGQTLQITSLSVTSTIPNCTQSFTQNVTLSVNPIPTLTGASQSATVCNGSAATINLTGLLANSTSTISYTINGVAQTAVTGVVANASGAAIFTTPALAAANNGQTLQVTGVTVTSATPNCSQSFTRNVTLSVNPTPTLTGASLAATVCSGSTATINMSGLLASSTSTINYTINGVAQTAITGVVANASGVASFSTSALTAANNGQILQITGVTTTSATPNCTQSFTQNVTLAVNPTPTLSGASQAADVCTGSAATINLTGLVANSTSSVSYSINGVAQTAITGVVANASGAASFTTPVLTSANNGQTLQITGISITSTVPNCSQSFTQNVSLVVNGLPSAGAGLPAICQGTTSVTLGGVAGSGSTSAVWSDGSNGGVFSNNTGSTPGTATYTSSISAPSTVTLTLTQTGGACGTRTVTKNVTVNTSFTPTVSLASNDADNTFCAGTSVIFTATGANFGGGTASYNFKVASVSAQNSASTSYTTSGIANGQAVTVDLVVTGGTCLTSSTVTSNAITNTVYTPAVITTHPASKTVCIGTDASFNVAATGSNLTYQFRKGGVPISGATLVSYLISLVTASDAGSYDVVISTNGACPVTSNAATLSVTNNNQWGGSVNTDWHVAGNWVCGVIPNSNLDAFIPTGSSIVIQSGNTGISKNLSVASGASLSMQKGSVLQVYGDWSDNGTFNPGTGKVEFKGNATTQTIDKSSGNKTEQYYKLNIDKVSGSTLISSTTSVDIIGGGTVNILSGQLDLNNRYFTLKSAPNQVVVDGVTHSVDSTARLGTVTGTLVNSSNFGIERYISALTPKPRMLSTSVLNMQAAQMADSVSIFGGNFRPLAGFPSTTSTLYRYDESLSFGTLSRGFVAITNKATVLPVGKGFRVLVGYDNYATYTSPVKPAVTLKMRGVPQIGSMSFPVTKTGSDPYGWNMLGNPYPCEISWNSIYNDNQSTLSSTVAMLDPKSSGTSDYYYYNAFTNTAVDPRYSVGVAPSTFGTSPRYNGDLIASSQGFFVFKTAMGSGSVNFSESQKVVTPGMVESNFRVAESEATSQRLNLVAVTNTGYIDNSYLFFSPDAKAKGFDAQYDAYKFSNSNVTISTNTFGKDMAMNGVEAISTANMSIPVHITTKAAGTHSLYVEGIETLTKNASVFLDDNYLHTTTELKPNNNQYVFNFTADTATTAQSRFVLRVAESEIVTDVVDPNLAISVSVYPNPSLGQATITLKNASSGNYTVELIDTRGIVALRKNVVVSGGKTEVALENLHSFLDAGLYIVRITGSEHTYLDKLVLIK